MSKETEARRSENSRQYKSIQELFARRPELGTTANAHVLTEWAEENGGKELISADWFESQLQNPELVKRLGVLSVTPQSQFDDYMSAHPWLDNHANRILIAERMTREKQSVEEVVESLGRNLAFNREVFDDHATRQAVEEREQLVQMIVSDYSLNQGVQNEQTKKLERASIEQLRQRAQEIQNRKYYRQFTSDQLKHVLRQESERRILALQPVLPAEITASAIKAASPAQIEIWRQRWGWDLLNQRLNETKTPYNFDEVRQSTYSGRS